METIAAKRVYYEIKESLGRGLTSEVFKAFRKDPDGLTRQEVALKIIKSKKDVPVLKQEFMSLSRVRSKYCVRILAWETLPQGPALVLEFIDGVTLHELNRLKKIPPQLIVEILVQVNLGLKTLHRHKIFHGDLNLRNIMVNREGLVKLIDFGFQGEVGEQFLTPKFAAPERLAGGAPTEFTDRFSLQKIAETLTGESVSGIAFLREITRAARRRELATLVEELQGEKQNKTFRLPARGRHQLKKRIQLMALSAALFLLTVLIPLPKEPPEFFQMSLRSSHWFQYSINGLPSAYGPLAKKRLRKGLYNVSWGGGVKSHSTSLELNRHQTFLLQPEPNSL